MNKPELKRLPRAKVSGFTLILGATGIAGVASYLVMWIVPNQIGLAGYAVFASLWSFLYLVVGTLGGVQQEVTRATLPIERMPGGRASKARNFGLWAGLLVFLVIVCTSPLWVGFVFPADGWKLVWPLAVGASASVMVAVLAGTLYGASKWKAVALMVSVDAVMRLVAVSVVLIWTDDVVALAWAVALPFPLTLLILWPFFRNSIVGRTQLDVGYRALTWNVSRTMVAAAGTGIMVSGFPLVLGVSSAGEAPELLGLFILTITLTRAPLIIVAMSLQSYFLIMFRDNVESFWKRFLSIQALVFGAAIVLAGAGWLIGPAVFGFLFPGQLQPEGWFIAVLVFSSAFVGAMCISAPAVLARSQHFVYTSGWVVAAMVTVLALLMPLDFTARTCLALVAGPVAGLLIHGIFLATSRRSRPRLITQ
ncbi:lipopolysaccharide biosynthesis protein [Cryobacterium psychrophilum]|uniref:Uncharacterized protein n=1 Tax=Cryobacterium psychrophilum TaxID=41988 RepID=A0A4Y8KRK2_9MICO|nr:hypothetical protein [Cryobacterium psychrophilum]TDW30700.1 hypothetical protein EDD25_2470 [Cryobacterium psychrophilum]TFD76617.1 hypothetical protein E3T53_13235 [Cryobacterium psychrophilum]